MLLEFFQKAKEVATRAVIIGQKIMTQPPSLSVSKSEQKTHSLSNTCPNCYGKKFVYSQGSMHFCWMCMDQSSK